MLKETRARGGGYWYAYRYGGDKIVKKYLGRSEALGIERLEAVAAHLSGGEYRQTEGILREQEPAGEGRYDPLLTPKLRVPGLRSKLIVREELLTRLDMGQERKVTLVSAPAGYGKTTLVGSWVHRLLKQRGARVAWLALDEGDNDPVRFVRYLSAACRLLLPEDKTAPLLDTLSVRQGLSFEQEQALTIITLLLNALSEMEGRGVLVLEDYHEITTPLIERMMELFIEHMPNTVRLVLVTRHDPSLKLARLRASSELLELRVHDLRFSVVEIEQFLAQIVGMALSREVIETFSVRVEGWVVGLQLVALALQGRNEQGDSAHMLANFSGDQRYVSEYFVSEVLQTQTGDVQEFLLQSSLLSHLTVPLCNEITGRSDSEQVLARLEAANLFLVTYAGAGQWYRYHALFVEAMRVEARRRFGEASVQALIMKACHWYEGQQMWTEAIESALGIGAFPYAARIMEPHIVTMFAMHEVEEFYTLRRWLDALPKAVLQTYPELCFAQAIALLFTEDRYDQSTRARMEIALREAEQAWQVQGRNDKLGQVLALRALVMAWQRHFQEALQLSWQALTLLPHEERLWRGIALVNAGKGAQMQGKLHEARQLLVEGVSCCEAARNIYPLLAATIALGNICFEQGESVQAQRYYQRVSEIGTERWQGFYREGQKALDDRAMMEVGLAQIWYERNEMERAEQAAQYGFSLGQQLESAYILVAASLVLARIWQARGQHQRAGQYLESVYTQVGSQWHLREVRLEQVWQVLRRGGDSETARHVFAMQRVDDELVPYTLREQQVLLQGHMLIMEGRAGKALELLRPWHEEAGTLGRVRSQVQFKCALALACIVVQEKEQAGRYLRQALEQASLAGYRRIMLDQGERMQALLRMVQGEMGVDEPGYSYLREILLAGEKRIAGGVLQNVLSPQEQRVLRLLMAGRSRPEIAEEMIVSINTVKTQVRNIYRKLRVSSRKEACEIADRFHLL